MSDKTKTLLEEIYIIEPSLRNKEEIVIRVIAEMQQKKPEIIIDEAFKKALRAKVMHELLKKEKQPVWYIILPFVSGLSLAVFGFFFMTQYVNTPHSPLEQRHPVVQKVSFQNVIEKKGEKAFGAPVLQAYPVTQTLSRDTSNSHLSLDQKVKEETTTSVSPGMMMATPKATKMIAPSDAMMPYPTDFPYYTYVYTGSLPETQTGFTVYKKNGNIRDKKFANGLLSSLSIDSVALSAFENANVTNLTFSEDKEYDYTVNIDFNTMSVSLSQNWEKWPTPKCDANGCETPKALTKEDSISADTLKMIGKTFLNKYGVDMSSYGEPKVQDSFPMIAYAGMKTESTDISPEQYTLIYPLLIDGKEIREEYGGYKGITLTIDTRTKRVTSMFGLEKQTLESSYYTGVISSGTLHDYVRYGGKYETKPLPEQKIVEVALDTPTLQYVRVYGEWKDGVSPEYYIPAYMFPVKKDGASTLYLPEQITVPALEEFAKIVPTGDVPVVSPMPLIMENSSR